MTQKTQGTVGASLGAMWWTGSPGRGAGMCRHQQMGRGLTCLRKKKGARESRLCWWEIQALTFLIDVSKFRLQILIFASQNLFWASLVAQQPVSAGDVGSNSGLGRSPGGGNGKPPQYSCLGNSRDGGAWWAAVHGVARVRQDLATKQQQIYFTCSLPILAKDNLMLWIQVQNLRSHLWLLSIWNPIGFLLKIQPEPDSLLDYWNGLLVISQLPPLSPINYFQLGDQKEPLRHKLDHIFIVVVQSLSHVWLSETSWTAAHQASLSCLCSNSAFSPKLRVGCVLNPGEQKSWEFRGVLHHKAWRQGCSHPCNSLPDPVLCDGGTELSRGNELCERTLK